MMIGFSAFIATWPVGGIVITFPYEGKKANKYYDTLAETRVAPVSGSEHIGLNIKAAMLYDRQSDWHETYTQYTAAYGHNPHRQSAAANRRS